MRVIAISGKAQSGKDTAARIIKDKLELDGYNVLIIHYADLLKHICRQYFGWNGIKDSEGRHLLQYVGTDIIRKQNPDYWVDFVISFLEFFPNKWDYVIIPDCRFPNEIERLRDKKIDAVCIRVARDKFESILDTTQKEHISETAMDNVKPDGYINNLGTINDFHDSVLCWLENFIKSNK